MNQNLVENDNDSNLKPSNQVENRQNFKTVTNSPFKQNTLPKMAADPSPEPVQVDIGHETKTSSVSPSMSYNLNQNSSQASSSNVVKPPAFLCQPNESDEDDWGENQNNPVAINANFSVPMPVDLAPTSDLRARALYDYQASADDEISFDPDDIITEIVKIDEGWWQGLCKGMFGLFPANYVELIE